MFSKLNITRAVVIGVLQTIMLIVLFIYCRDYIKQVIADNQKKNGSFLDPLANDVGLTKVDWQQVKKAKPQPVTAGIYLDRIQDFDILHSRWSYEFYAWFKWNPHKLYFMDLQDSVRGAITIQKSPVKIVNGTIENLVTQSFYLNSKGDSAYVLFHITGTTTKFFDVSQYPLDNYLLMVQLESVNYDVNRLVFVPDSVNSNVSSRVSVNGFDLDQHIMLVKPHTIKSSLGDPREASNQRNTNSQLRFALFIKRGGFAIYLKIFITLYISVFLGFLSFFAAENDRIRVIVGSLFFAAATLNIIISRIPTTSGISVAEIVNDVSLVTILLIAARETFLRYLFRNNKQLDKLNKWITFSITLIFYVLINIAIPVMCVDSLR